MEAGIQLNRDVYSIFTDKFDETSCVALALSGVFDGFPSVFTETRKLKGRLVVNRESFYFTPTSWTKFIDQYITLDSIKVCNLNHLYWLPADLLVGTILQMPNLEELSVKGTQVCTFCQLARILKACPKVVKLDFTYTEQKEKDIWTGLSKEEEDDLRDHLTAGFRKLTRLKMSTVPLDAKNDIFNDPWHFIITILTLCRDCKDLTVEMTYAGAFELYWCPSMIDDDALDALWNDWFPKLNWMFSLESLVIIEMDGRSIISRLLDDLWRYLFPSHMMDDADRTILPLRCLWVENFEVSPSFALHFVNPECLRSFYSGKIGEEEMTQTVFPNLENLSASDSKNYEELLLEKLSKLKFYRGSFSDEASYKFCEKHPNLEDLYIEYDRSGYLDVPSDAVCKLHKLKSFTCYRNDISKEFIEAMTEAYPILNILRLTTHPRTLPPDGNAVLSAFRFPHLTTLNLSNLQLLDGSALIPIIIGCPKLEMVHLQTGSLDSSSFPTNLKDFLLLATKLRDFTLRWEHKEDAYPATAYAILKAILEDSIKKSIKESKLERLALIDAGTVDLPDWKPPPEVADFLVRFTAQMTHLTCCCLTFKQMDIDLMKAIKERVEKEVVNERPSLWFHLGRHIPDASDPGVPPIHYHQILEPISFTTPPFYTV